VWGHAYIFPHPAGASPEDFTVSLTTAVVMSIQQPNEPMRHPFTGVYMTEEEEDDLQLKCDVAEVDGPRQHRAFLRVRSNFDEQLESLRSMLKIHNCLQCLITAATTFSWSCESLSALRDLTATQELCALYEKFLPPALVCMSYNIAQLDYDTAEEGLIAVRQVMNPESDLIERSSLMQVSGEEERKEVREEEREEDREEDIRSMSNIIATACHKALVILRTRLYNDRSLRPNLSNRSYTEADSISITIGRLLDTALVELSNHTMFF